MNRIKKLKERADVQRLRELHEEARTPVAEETGIDGISESRDYPTRGPRDVVISGPLLGRATGPGRVFATWEEALYWAQDKYGIERVSLVKPNEEAVRWAVLVKNLAK